MDVRNKNFKLQIFFLTTFVIVSEVLCSGVPRPRGVSLSRAALYSTGNTFTCFDSSKTIPFTQVNDDYCDCSDASDEPGTSACPHGIFHCTNAGHKPMNLPSSRVDDGICDCCDGTDELGNKRVNCPNICLQLGRYAREEAQRKAELIKAGKELRKEFIQNGAQLKQEKKEKLGMLHKNKEEAEKVKQEKKTLKDELEALENQALEFYRRLEEEEKKKNAEAEAEKNRAEATETFTKFDSNQDGVIEISEIQVRQTFDKDKNGEVSIEEAKYFLNNEEAVDIEKFITDAWPNIKPYLMLDAGLFKPPAPETSHDEAEDMETEEHELDENAQEEGEEEEEEEEPYQPEDHIETPSLARTYDEETQKLVDQATAARNAYTEAERAVRDIDSEISNIEQYFDKDFGPEEEFAVLQGQCFEYSDHEYVYKLCPFEKATQQQKSGHSETKLGAWGRWDGSEEDKYESMLYDRGQSCWNGPQRSTKVTVSCGIENEVTSVSEPNRCEYHFDFSTPAACKSLPSDSEDDLHDEL